MTSPLAKCPNPMCACPVQAEDVFCPNCGEALNAAPENMAAGPAEGRRALLQTDLAGERQLPPGAAFEGRDETELVERPAVASAARLEAGQRAAEPAAREEQHLSDCSDLEVRYNNSCVFVLNMQSTFDVEIRPRVEGIRDLSVEVRQSGQVIAHEKPRVLPRRGVPLSFGLNYTPRNTHAGKVSFEILVGYRKEQQRRLYAAYRTHTIYSGKEDARQVCESLVVEVKNNIQQGHAGDLRVDQNFHELREALRERSTIAQDREFLQLINGRPFWTSLPLGECAQEPVGGSGPVPRLEHVVLRRAEGAPMHLLLPARVRIGRARDCEILARVLDAAGRQLTEPSLRIGRYHACVEWQGDKCQIRDGGYYAEEKRWRPSSTGVWIDGQRLAAGKDFTLAPGRDYRMTLGAPGEDGRAGFELTLRVWLAGDLPPLRPGCPDLRAAPQAAACLVARRTEGPPEAFVLLRLAANLAWADARCAGACVCLRDRELHLSDGHGCDRLVAGRRIWAGGGEFQVLDGAKRANPT